MARTSKSRGSIPFELRSGNKPSPNKFLGGLGKKIGGAMMGAAGGLFGGLAGKVGGKLFGGGGGGPASAIQASRAGAGGALYGGMNKPNLPPGGGFGDSVMSSKSFVPPEMMGGRSILTKKEGYTPYKTDAILVRGAYDASSGKGTTKYGNIAKARALGNISEEIGETAGVVSSNIREKRKIKRESDIKHKKKEWKKDRKFEGWKKRKETGWKDNIRYG